MNTCFLQSLNNFKYGILKQCNFIQSISNKFGVLFFTKLVTEGFIAECSFTKKNNIPQNKILIKIYYKYNKNAFFLQNIHIFTKPSCKIYKTYNQILNLKQNTIGGTFFFTTTFGILTDVEILQKRIGGILLCYLI